MDDYLGVGCGPKRVTASLEFGHELDVVVNLAVQHNRDRAILVENRLMPALEVNDRETPHSEEGRAAFAKTGIIRPAVPQTAQCILNCLARQFALRPAS